MTTKRRNALAAALAAAAMLAAAAPAARAVPIVAQGYDLLQTFDPGFGAPPQWLKFETGSAPSGEGTIREAFVGNPAKISGGLCPDFQFNFGEGCVNTGSADTILRRTTNAGNLVDLVNIDFVALSLRSRDPIEFGPDGSGGRVKQHVLVKILKDLSGGWDSRLVVAGFPNTGLTGVQSTNRIGPIDTYSMHLSYFAVLTGEDTGFFTTGSFNFSPVVGNWSRTPPAGAVAIDGVNRNLNGVDSSEDFWIYPALSLPPRAGNRLFDPATVPAPAALPLLATAMGAMLLLRRRMRRDRA